MYCTQCTVVVVPMLAARCAAPPLLLLLRKFCSANYDEALCEAGSFGGEGTSSGWNRAESIPLLQQDFFFQDLLLERLMARVTLGSVVDTDTF